MSRKNSELEELIQKIALLNAVRHEGKAQVGAVIGKILGEKPELRNMIKEVSQIVNRIVNDVNKIPPNAQKGIVEEKWPEALVKEKVEEEKRLLLCLTRIVMLKSLRVFRRTLIVFCI